MYDDQQDTFKSRYKYFKDILHPVWLFKSKQELLFARDILNDPSVPNKLITEKDVRWAKSLYASAFHPDTKEINPIVGRMSFQIPGNTIVTALMLTFYRTPMQLITTQWMNQSFMAYCNYTNRNAQSSLSTNQIALAYLSATTTAVTVSYALGQMARKSNNPLAAKFVPFFAVCAGNVVNVPLMRQQDFISGIAVNDKNGEKLGESRRLGCLCLAQVVATRICAAIPLMILPPIAMSLLTKRVERSGFKFHKGFGRPLWIFVESSMIGICAFIVLPIAVALFPQHSSVHVDKLEPTLRNKIHQQNPTISHVYYNKGL